MKTTNQEAAEGWKGLETEDARRLRQSCCQLRWRPAVYAKPRDGSIPTIAMMTGAILERMQDESGAPKGGLAHILDVRAATVSQILGNQEWPKGTPKPESALAEAGRWIVQGGKRRLAALEAEPKKKIALEAIARDIKEYFFPRQQHGETTASYFEPSRLMRDQPCDRRELGILIQWLRRQIKLERCPGQLILACSTEEASNVFSEKRMHEELALAAVQSEHLDVVIIRQRKEHANKLVKSLKLRGVELKVADEAKYKRRTGRGVRDVVVASTDPLSHPLFGYVYLAYGPIYRKDAEERRDRMLVLRPFGGGLGSLPLTFTSTALERQTVVQWIEKHGVAVLGEKTKRITDDETD